MTAREAVNWLINITADIGKAEHRDLWHYEQALSEIREMLEMFPSATCGNLEKPERPQHSEGEAEDCNLDCISRSAAIDAMCELMRHWFGGDPKDEIREIKRELEKLPSAQPERRTDD